MAIPHILEVANMSDAGCRSINEDSTASNKALGVLLLADGMGGHNSGEIASSIAVASIYHRIETGLQDIPNANVEVNQEADTALIIDAINAANVSIYNAGQQHLECKGMGTTIVATLIRGDSVVVGHVGDSRLYRMRGNNLIQITEDHSLLQEIVNSGILSLEEAENKVPKNIITKALGLKETVKIDVAKIQTVADDIYLLCSDGLTDIVKDDEIRLTLNTYNDSLDQIANKLVSLVIDRGGTDNVSVIIAKVPSH